MPEIITRYQVGYLCAFGLQVLATLQRSLFHRAERLTAGPMAG